MLYSKNGAYPRPLPFRIVMPNNTTRTDPATFTPEEIAATGYVAVPDPPAPTRHEALGWSGTEWTLTDGRTLESAKAIRLLDLKEVRQSKEKNFTWNGVFVYLDDKTQNRLDAALKGLELAPLGTLVNWEVSTGTFVDFDLNTLRAFAFAAWNHIRLCFVTAKTITTNISNCTTIAEVDAIDIATGWPGLIS